MGMKFEDILQYTKKIPGSVELEYMDLDYVLEQLPFLKPLFEKYPGSYEAVAELRNKIRSTGQHAGGVILSGLDKLIRGKEVWEIV